MIGSTNRNITGSCWILSTVRTGSTFLCELLNGTGLFQPYANYDKAFSEWFSVYKSKDEFLKNIPKTCKVHYSQYRKFFRDADRKVLELNLHPLRFVLLRRDCFAQAISFAIAKKYKTFIVNGRNKDKWDKVNVFLTNEEMVGAYEELSGCYNKWDNFLKDTDCLSVDYNELLNNPVNQLKRVLEYMEINYGSLEINCNTFPMTKEANPYYIERLKCLIEKR